MQNTMESQERIKEIFNKHDINCNGVLEKDEGKTGGTEGISSLGEEKNEQEIGMIVEEAIIKFDLNKNGIIEYPEFIELINFLINERGLAI